MTFRRGSSESRRLLTGFVVASAVFGCTNTYIYNQQYETEVPRDRTLAIEGDFCTPGTNEVVRPIKIIVAMDSSQSMQVTDPDGTRALALVDLIDNLPQEDEIYLSVMLFSGSTTAFLTRSGLADFEQVNTLSPGDRLNLRQRILSFTAPGTAANRDATDFVKPLSDIYALINRDIANTRLGRNNQTVARYSVIFLSDGQPTNNQDDELLCGDAVRRIRQLKDLADDVKVNTVHVFLPTQPIASTNCALDGGIIIPTGMSCLIPNLPPGACPLLIINQNAERLQRMATLGGGDFRDFRNNEPINFLNFRFGNVRRTFVFDKLIAANLSMPPGSPLDRADTDSDGLLDADECVALGAAAPAPCAGNPPWNTDPWVVDTDQDGFSDGVEVYYRGRGGNFTPDQILLPDGGGVDPGCPPEARGLDSDCDGLLDCDEQIIGTNARRLDSDDDGVLDTIEWQMGTAPSSRDLDQDPDNDQLMNGEEVALHTDPHEVDSQRLSTIGYRYEVHKRGGINDAGQQCFDFRVDNVSLAHTLPDTRDAGNPDGGAPLYRRGAGFNDIIVSVSMRPGDDVRGHTMLKLYRTTTPRYPVGGIRSPVDGIIRVRASDFMAGCPPVLGPPTP